MEPASPAGPLVLRGPLVDGAGQGRRFTTIDWVRRRFRDLLGIDPHPGTINVRLETLADRAAVARLRAAPGIPIPPEPGFCAATCYHAVIEGPARAPGAAGRARIPAAIVVPDLPDYPADQVELVAAVNVRAALALRTGDLLTITVPLRPPAPGSPISD